MSGSPPDAAAPAKPGPAPSAPARTASAGRLLHAVCRGCAALGVVVLFACALLTVVDIVRRAAVGESITGLVDLTQLMVMVSVFLWLPYVFEQRANIEVDLLFGRLPRGARRWLDRLWPLAGAAFLLAAAWHAGRAALQALEYGDGSATLGMPMTWFWAPVLFGTVLAAVVCVVQTVRSLSDPQAGAMPHDPGLRSGAVSHDADLRAASALPDASPRAASAPPERDAP